MSSDSAVSPGCGRRRSMKIAVGALCTEAGFTHADEDALETLTEMICSYIHELGKSAQAFTELSCRTKPMATDVVMALVEMGTDMSSLQAHAQRTNKTILLHPSHSMLTPNLRTLQAGEKQQHPAHIPDYLPPFPDPHTYIRTLMHKKPQTEYQLIREKAASQKRDVERALTRFIAKTGETENLFPDDPYAYPLIACMPKALPYMDALLPKDHDLDAQEDIDDDKKKSTEPLPTVIAQKDEMSTYVDVVKTEPGTMSISAGRTDGPDVTQSQELTDADGQIDNPYLREIKMPKFKLSKKKY